MLLALQPWSLMMRDVLGMLVEAGAQGDGDQLELRLELDKTGAALCETLAAFRRQADVAERRLMQSGRRWGALDLWDIFHPDVQDHRRAEIDAQPEFKAWQRRYWNGERGLPPRLRPTGHAAFDAAVAELQVALDTCLLASQAAGDTTYDRWTVFHSQPERDFGHGWMGAEMTGYDSDRAVGQILSAYGAAPLAGDWDANRARAAAEYLRERLARTPAGDPIPERIRGLLDVLDLPIWRRRHELYSVWVASLIRQTCTADWAWHAPDRVLSFAFSGSKIADIDFDGYPAELWAELRRPANLQGRSRYRRNNVQPDYSLVLGPDSATGPVGLVVECKQYRSSSRRNFISALEDYAVAHPFACVLLVNYGAAGAAHTRATELHHEREIPVEALGAVRPLGAGRAEAIAWVGEQLRQMPSLAQVFEIPPTSAPPPTHQEAAKSASNIDPAEVAATVVLRWTSDSDLDLHLEADPPNPAGSPDRIDFASRGAFEAPPWILLDGDQRSAGAEIIRISRRRAGACHISVNLYTGAMPRDGEAEVEVRLADGAAHRFRANRSDFPHWRVCRIDLGSGEVTPVGGPPLSR